ncbi:MULTISPECIES: glycoside hydrolase family 26 protein [Bradyrhizobium]|uniref:glycoside hydrolase family 26 protein n=1 Tax=Bradyrhizobium elkanii TaxID=29448 RepID=UPI0003FD70D1|nr:hypothetical protein [Bradyrhizobium elkanii]
MAGIERLSRRRFVGGLLTASVGAVLGDVATARDAAGATSRLGADPARFAGAFVNWEADGREHALQAWEKWLKQKPSSVLGMDFYGQSTWEDFRKVDWVPGIWRRLNPKRNVVWSMPLTITGTPLVDVADGLHDSEFEAAARAISDAQPRAIIRLGWEMNLSQMGWFAKGQEADYIRAFRRVAEIFRRASSEFKFDWCPGWGAQEMPADLAYPGDDVVDYIGLDVYDFKSEGSVEERWQTLYLKAPFGLEWHRDFAARHGKRISFPEWGVGHAGDNPYFIQKMHDWFVENSDSIAYAAYFNVDGLWPTQIDTGRFPESEKLFRKLFGGR